jgi:signal transduction histidine kinase/CheY-like chemotaxis protein
VAIVDSLSLADAGVPILYLFPLLIIARRRDERAVWVLVAICVSLDILVFAFGPRPASGELYTGALFSRILAAVAIAAIGLVLHFHIRAERTLDAQRERLSVQNLELEEVNQELGQREEEIVRQNEELQSQTEELERQSEELRLTNEELAAREKGLEQLLELSRSITVELSRDDVMNKVCSALGILTETAAAAVLEKRGESMKIICHYGFGDGPDVESIPVNEAFGSLALSMGQTAYIENLSQRPDLRVPQRPGMEPFVSVLAAPVRVGTQAVATLEVYALTPLAWTDAQVATLESVAAQLSISLHSAAMLEGIAEERRRFEAAFRSVPVGMLLLADPEGNEIRVNPTGAALLGVPTDENLSLSTAAGTRLRKGLFRDGKQVALPDLPTQRVLRGEEVWAEDYEIALVDGRKLSIVVSASPFYDATGKVTGGVLAFIDATPQKTLLRELELRRREAEEASVRKTRFLAAISHDIRTPANAINLMAELIRRAAGEHAAESQIPGLAERLQQNVTTLLDLVGDLLDLARFDSGKGDLVETEFPLSDLLEREVDQLRPMADSRGVELIVQPASPPVWLYTDRVKLARVFANLIENAIKFTPRGTVRVSAERTPDRKVRIRVADTGVGIAPEHLARIFDEFIQVRNPERDVNKGSGLGLAICKRLVDLLGGTIDVQSVPGTGATFTVELPSSAIAVRLDSAPPTPTRSDAPTPGGRLPQLRVLLVEDHRVTREGTRDLLKQEGAAVVEASDGAHALKLLRDASFEVVILDLMLPDMDGNEILESLHSKRPSGLKGVLVLTGDLHEGRFPELRRLQPDTLIQKPVDIEKLVRVLQTFVSR